MKRFFGDKKNKKLRAETANTILSYQEGIAKLEKRWIFVWYWNNDVQHSPIGGLGRRRMMLDELMGKFFKSIKEKIIQSDDG